MWSFIVLDLENKLKLTEFLTFIKTNFNGYDVIYCSSKKKKSSEIKSYVFKNGCDKEEVLNTVAGKVLGEKVVIIRDVSKYKNILKLTESIKFDNQISCLKYEDKGIVNFFKNVFSKPTILLFGQELSNIDFSVVAYGQVATRVIKTTSNASALTRTNNFVGTKLILLEDGEKYSFKYNKTKAIFKFIIPIVIAIVAIVIRLLIKQKMLAIVTIGFIAFAIICLIMSFIYGLDWFIKSQIGDNVNGKAKYE